GIRVFKGIPYAAPPVGDLRWRPPQPPKQWSGVRQADKFSDSCVQVLTRSRNPWTKEFMVQNNVSEDCLCLNVWTGAKNANEKRPVFVWIHGGAFSEGSGEVATYDGEELAKQGLIVVTINYRLGAFGFFSHPELTKESPHHASGNYGLLDCVAALQWVQKNIAAFGGDPSRVTLAGQSAGAIAVHSLLAAPLMNCKSPARFFHLPDNSTRLLKRRRAGREIAGVRTNLARPQGRRHLSVARTRSGIRHQAAIVSRKRQNRRACVL
ncbi:MAG: carboxylesterase family protein, partial [Acidobacteriota bacterium]